MSGGKILSGGDPSWWPRFLAIIDRDHQQVAWDVLEAAIKENQAEIILSGGDPSWWPRFLAIIDRDHLQVAWDVLEAAIKENQAEINARAAKEADRSGHPMWPTQGIPNGGA